LLLLVARFVLNGIVAAGQNRSTKSINALHTLASSYSPEFAEGSFCELRPYGILRSSPKYF
jgi:hypothetical protein